MAKLGGLFAIVLAFAWSCGPQQQLSEVRDVVDMVKDEYAPDRRTSIFDIEVSYSDGCVLKGETNLTEAKTVLLDRLEKQGNTVYDQITLLPGSDVGEKKFGVVNVSVANLRSAPKHSAELSTQALLGMPLLILKKQGSWLLVQTPEKYIAWTNSGSVQLMNQHEFSFWKDSDKVIYLETYGFAESEDGGRISDLVAGNILKYQNRTDEYWEVAYPDGRIGRIISNEAIDLLTWSENIQRSDSSIIQAARQLMGVPYLWGGTSSKGVDCSGFTKTIYLLHGLVLPRDASQQVHSGVLVDSLKDFSTLEVGDLLFFGRVNEDRSEKVIHVGLWIGNDQFIHASGDVHVSSMDSLDANFDSYNYNRYLRTKRITNGQDKTILSLKDLFK